MSVKKNLIYNITYQILIMILPLITVPYISRTIGAEGLGLHSYTYSIASYFVLFSMLGINNHGNRSIAKVSDNRIELSKIFISIYLVQISISILMIILYVFIVNFMIKDHRALYYIQLIYIVSSLLDINWFFLGMQQIKLVVIRNMIIKIISVLSIFLFVKDSNNLYIYSFILAISNLISQIILWKELGKYIEYTPIIISDSIKQIKPILILFIPVISVSIYKIMDKIMLGLMSTIMQVGFFENSEKIVYMPIGVITALGTVMLPKMTNIISNGEVEQGKKYILMSMELIMFISIGSTFGLIGVGKTFIPLFLGNEFVSCIDIVSILSVSMIFLAWANVIRTQHIIPNNKDKIYIKSTILGAIVNLITNFMLIGRFGAIGASIGTILAEASVAIYQTINVKKELDVKLYLKRSIVYFIPGVIMLLAIYSIDIILSDSLLKIIIQIVLGGGIYTTLSVVCMIFNKSEIIKPLIKGYKEKLGSLSN